MHIQRTIILLLAIVGALCTFAPWIKIPFLGDSDGRELGGWLTLTLFLLTAILACIGKRESPFGGALFYLAITASALAGVIALYQILDMKSSSGNVFQDMALSMVSLRWGIYLVAILGFSVPSAGLIMKAIGRKQH
jgi:hypothetical protein